MAETCGKILNLRSHLLRELLKLFPSRLRFVRLPGQSQRQVVELDNELQLSIQICRPAPTTVSGERRWYLRRQSKELHLPGLICITDEQVSCIKAFYVVPGFGDLIKRSKMIRVGQPFLSAGKRLQSMSELCDVAKEVVKNWKPQDQVSVVRDVVISRDSTVIIRRKNFRLPQRAAAVFKVLVCNVGKVVQRETLCKIAQSASRQSPCEYHSSNETYMGNVISVLRKRIRPFGNRILTVRNEGYMYLQQGRGTH